MSRLSCLFLAATCLLAGPVAESSPWGDGGGETPSHSAPPKWELENGAFTAELNGFNIHYEVHGQGPVMMTVPNSWGLTHQGLRSLYRALEEHLTMVYFDPRGMGRSDPIREDADMSAAAVRADFDALRRHLGLEKVHAIGWSNGAMNLIILAGEYSDTLESAIFLHGAASFSAEDNEEFAASYPELVAHYQTFGQEMQAAADMPIEEQDARTKKFNLELSFPFLFADREVGREKLQEIYRDADFSWRHNVHQQTEWPTFDERERLATIPVRSLVIAGRHDMIRPDQVEAIHTGLPDSQFLVFENSAHFAPIEEPEAFIAAVREFLGL